MKLTPHIAVRMRALWGSPLQDYAYRFDDEADAAHCRPDAGAKNCAPTANAFKVHSS
jgi:hypothetical protein